MKRFLTLGLVLIFSYGTAQDQNPPNIILMIGDGMGLTQITAGMYAQGNTTVLEQFEAVGLAKTHAHEQLVTDSAASGTAMACGEKTYNGVLGINPKNERLESILEYAQTQGYLSALLATSSIVHATPAAFYANVDSRKKYQEIALQMSESKVDYFIGGGRTHFTTREDNRNLIQEMRDYDIVNSLKKFEKSTASKIGFFTDEEEPKPIAQGRYPDLDEMVNATLDKLATKNKPFFMMVEGSQIDWGGHANELNYVLSEFKDFDKAVAAVLAFAKKQGNTLVIVTADHETGGFSLLKGSVEKSSVSGKYSTTGHSAAMVPVFAYGPGAASFSGIYENTSIFKKMKVLIPE